MSDPDLRDPRLDGAYRGTSRDEPPPALDERIRAAARRAVAARPESLEAQARRSWASRWRVPLSVAATALIAVTLSYMVQEEQTFRSRVDGLTGPTSTAPSVPASRPEPAAPATREQEARPPAAAAPVAPAPLQKRQATVETQAPEATEAPKREAPEPARSDLERGRANEAIPRPVPPAPPAEGALQSAPGAPAAAPSPLMREERSRPGASDESSGRLSRDRALSDRPVGAAPAAAPERKTAVPAATRTPEAWLEDIRRLKAQGRDAEAAAELAEFRKRYPDYVLPADLAR